MSGLGRPGFLGEPLARGLDPRAVDQEMQRASAGPLGDGEVQTFLATRPGAEIRHRPIQPGKRHKAATSPVVCRSGKPNSAFGTRQACTAASGRWPNHPACRPALPAKGSPGQTRSALSRAASGRPCSSASLSCGRSQDWVCASMPTNSLESRREPPEICATEPGRHLKAAWNEHHQHWVCHPNHQPSAASPLHNITFGQKQEPLHLDLTSREKQANFGFRQEINPFRMLPSAVTTLPPISRRSG